MLEETVRIKMPMPKGCKDCPLCVMYDYYTQSSSFIEGDPREIYRCVITDEDVFSDLDFENGFKRHESCPIVDQEHYHTCDSCGKENCKGRGFIPNQNGEKLCMSWIRKGEGQNVP